MIKEDLRDLNYDVEANERNQESAERPVFFTKTPHKKDKKYNPQPVM